MDVLFHLLIPFALLKLSNVKSKFAYLLLPLAIVLDLPKIFLPRETHSIVVVAAMLAFIYLICFLLKRTDKNLILGISAFYLFSHLVLDLSWYIALFWPIITDYYQIILNISIRGILPAINFSINTVQQLPNAGGEPQILRIESIGLIALAMALIIAKKISEKK